MKEIAFTFIMGLTMLMANGQPKQGRVVYERTVEMQMFVQGSGENEMRPPLPPSRKDKLEVLFGNNQSLCRTIDDEMPDPDIDQPGPRMHVMIAGADDITYADFTTGRIMVQRELGTKNYVVSDSIHRLSWKLTGDTATILDYPCQKAVAYRVEKHPMMTMDNGEMKSRDVTDTARIAVWFTLSIPVPAGPEYAGQLPGLILGIDINDGRTVYKAVSISDKVDLADIKEPSKGKKVTAEEFAEQSAKLMKEMQRNGPERGRDIRFGP